MYNDKTIACKDCGAEFTFTASEQEFYAEKGFTNEPQRCKSCRVARKGNSRGGSRDGAQRQMYDAVCAECGKACQVPFQPSTDRPIKCSDCFRSNRY
jgi:CxxC-x17-CxxC domain-containing protein